MRNMSYWARCNPWSARICIILLYIPLNIAGLMTGDLLFSLGIRLPGSFLAGAMVLFAVTVFYYPGRHGVYTPAKALQYTYRKSCDLLLVVSSFLMICFTGNQVNRSTPFYPLATRIGGTTPGSHVVVPEESARPALEGPFTKKMTRKEMRKQLRHFILEIRRSYKNRSSGEKGLLIALTLVAALALFFLVIGLSCNIACGGAEGLAYVVFFGGTFLIIFLAIKVIQRINRGGPLHPPGAGPPISNQ